MTIVVTAEVFGQEAGSFVHENFILSLLPYVPAIGGLLLIGHWLREPQPATASNDNAKTT